MPEGERPVAESDDVDLARQLLAAVGQSVIATDLQGTVIYWNDGATQLYGYTESEALGQRLRDLVVPVDEVANASEIISSVLAGRKWTGEFSVRHRDGHVLRVLVTDSPIRNAEGDVVGIIGVSVDVTARTEMERSLRRSESRLRASEARYRVIAETAQEGIWAVDLEGRALYANQKTADLLRRDLSEVYTGIPAELLGIDPSVIAERVRGARRGGQRQFDDRYVAPDGELRILRVTIADLPDDDGRRIVGVLLMISDVTEVVAAQEKLTRQALQDPLTGLGNRALLLDRLTQALRRAERRSSGRVAVLFADLDHLKEVNDTCGHAEGDALLREVANRFVGSVRPGDTVARLGGDEFVVLCEDIDTDAARDVADRLLQVLSQPVRLGVAEHVPSASIGVAISPPMEPAELLEAADSAMYEAKRRGRAQIVMHPGS